MVYTFFDQSCGYIWSTSTPENIERTSFGRIRTICLRHDGEFTGHSVIWYHSHSGSAHRHAMPYYPKASARIGRFRGSVINAMCCSLAGASLATKYFKLALLNAVHKYSSIS